MYKEASLRYIIHRGINMGDPHIPENVYREKEIEGESSKTRRFIPIPTKIRLQTVSKEYEINQRHDRFPP